MSYQPFGLKPVKGLGQGEVRVNYYRVLSGTTRIFKGDLVTLANTGNAIRATSTTGPFLGVCMADSGASIAAGTFLPICDDPHQVFEVLRDGTAALAQTDLGLNYAYTVAAGDSALGQSRSKMGVAALTTANGLKALRLSRKVGNAEEIDQVIEVKINSHILQGATAGI
jgi:hypothetical protein